MRSQFLRVLFPLLLCGLSCGQTPRPPFTPPTAPCDAASPTIVFDAAEGRLQPKNFRTCVQLARAHRGDTTGLSDLRCSGSGMFTPGEMLAMKQSFVGKGIVVDLRQESHGWAHGAPFTWQATRNWANAGLTPSQVAERESSQLRTLDSGGSMGEIRSEEQIVRALGLGYQRFYVSDHVRPTDEEVDRFLAFVQACPPDAWLHFHCRAGVGRTTTFLVMFDMMHNADRVSFDEILSRQAALPPSYDLRRTEGHSGPAWERAEFLRAFYLFVRAKKAGFSGTWTQWLGSRSASSCGGGSQAEQKV